MFADIKQNMSLGKWEAQGDPQQGQNPRRLTQVHVAEKGHVAMVYTVISEQSAQQDTAHNIVFVFPMTKESGEWKLVFAPKDLGDEAAMTFGELSKEIQTYASQQHAK